MKIAPVNWPLSKEENISLVNFARAVVVEKLGQKPDWKRDKILKSLIYCDNWLWINFQYFNCGANNRNRSVII